MRGGQVGDPWVIPPGRVLRGEGEFGALAVGGGVGFGRAQPFDSFELSYASG
jgi:hypothetical protein